MRYIKFLITILILVTIAGCKVGPNYERPSVSSPDQFVFDEAAGDTILNLAWWEIFQDPVLDSLIRLSLDQNKNVRLAAARIEEARAAMRSAKADIWPSIGYEGSALRTNYSPLGGASPTENNSFLLASSLNWELDFWGKYRRLSEAARAELMATEYAHRSVMISLISEVAATYFQLLDYENRLEITLNTLETRRSYLSIIQARFDKGTVPEIDLNQAEIQEAIAASSVPYYRRMVGFTQNALRVLLGQNPGSVSQGFSLQEQPLPPDIPSGIPSQLLVRRPDILQAEQRLAAQTARIGAAQAMRFPSISLTGMLGIATTQLSSIAIGDDGVWAVSAGLMGPIFNFGKNKRRVEIERQRTEQALMEYEQAVIQAFREVEDALLAVSTYREEYEAIQRRKNSALNASNLSKARYDGGVTSYLEVLDSDRTLFDTELIESEVFKLRLNSYVTLYKVLGGGWISREEQQQASQTATSQ